MDDVAKAEHFRRLPNTPLQQRILQQRKRMLLAHLYMFADSMRIATRMENILKSVKDSLS